MNIPVTLPVLGEAIESATISRWLKAVGDRVAEGEPLVEVSTDKVDSEIESPSAGVLMEIRIDEDEVAAVGDVIAMIDSGADVPSPPASLVPAASASSDAGRSRVSDPAREPNPEPVTEVAAPVYAEVSQPAVDFIEVREPISQDAAAATSSALRGTTQHLTRLRKTIVNRMVESLKTSAQLTTIVEVDVTEIGRVRRRHNSELIPGRGIKLSYLPFISVAALGALRTYPQINSSVDPEAGTITYPDAEHLGIAVDTEKGLFVPVIRDAGSLSVTDLAARIADVAERTRSNAIGVDELSGGTFTITNTGSRGALMDTPIINQPQVAILGAGVVTRRPVVLGREGEGESIAIRSMVYLSLTYDHRVVDGADAARYLSAMKERLEHGPFDLE
jgi:pyruvate/2-oxoglutarate dehydrogenase complex dihydrolipoamide acyltransferase (E2) component